MWSIHFGKRRYVSPAKNQSMNNLFWTIVPNQFPDKFFMGYLILLQGDFRPNSRNSKVKSSSNWFNGPFKIGVCTKLPIVPHKSHCLSILTPLLIVFNQHDTYVMVKQSLGKKSFIKYLYSKLGYSPGKKCFSLACCSYSFGCRLRKSHILHW